VDEEALEACADEILERLTLALRPAMVVGVEVRRFGIEASVAKLARALGIPVVTSFMGRGLLAGEDVPLLGTYLGAAGDPAVGDLVEESDGLFLLGVILSDTNFGVSRRRIDLKRTIQALDGQVTLSHHTYPGIPIGALVEHLVRRARKLSTARAAEPQRPPSGMPHDDARVEPQDVAAALNDLMSAHGTFPFAADVGDCLFTAMDLIPTDYVAPGYYASMGFGVPAAIGVQVASGRRPIAIVGDGAFQMTGMELGHCKRLGLDPIVVVLNNGDWGMLSAFRPQAGYTRLGDWNLAACADALGGRGWSVRTRAQLAEALERAVRGRGQFHLLDVRIARESLSPTLRRFAGSIGAVSR
jgi:indolepyruvate decarboxylase